MLFELEWMGGTAERMFHQHRGDRIDAIDWKQIPTSIPDADRDRLRTVWTQSAHQEWCAAGAFTALLEGLLLARAPVDLIGMAGRFVADEMVHVELAARMAAAYGGGVPLDHDPSAIRPHVDATDPRLAAAELAIRVSCVGESFSLPIIASEFAEATDPVTKAVLGRIATDEGPHAKVGWLVLDWLVPHLEPSDLEHLGAVADDAVRALRPALAHHDELPFYTRILENRIRAPLAVRGVHTTAGLAA